MPYVLVTRRPEFQEESATETFRDHLGVGRAEAKSLTDAILDGRELRLKIATPEAAVALGNALLKLGANVDVLVA